MTGTLRLSFARRRARIVRTVDLLLDALLGPDAAGVGAAARLLSSSDLVAQAGLRQSEIGDALASIRSTMALDVNTAYRGDPACTSPEEAALAYPGVHALAVHRVAHWLWRRRVAALPRLLAECAHTRTGIDIHPGASIGVAFFVDHGTGVVIGETACVGDHCKLYQGVTLGALSTERERAAGVRRHPTLEDHVTVYANAIILGGTTVVGAGSVIGAGVFLTESVPANHVVTNPRPTVELRRRSRDVPLNYVI